MKQSNKKLGKILNLKKKKKKAELKLLQHAVRLLLFWMTECLVAVTSLRWQMHSSPVPLKDKFESSQAIKFRFQAPVLKAGNSK